MRMIKWFWLLLVLVWFRSVSAQTNVTIQQLRIQVMPEFDDPRLLVIIQGRLNAPADTFPRPVTFLVPRGSQINQMATMNVTTGETIPQAYDAFPSVTDNRWTEVTYTLDSAHFFYEYYDQAPAGTTDKQFNWLFTSPLPITDLLIEIQQPLKATNFSLEPAAPTTRLDNQFGFTYHQFAIGSLAANDEWVVQATYQKSDPAPSISRDQLNNTNTGQTVSISPTDTATTVAPAGTSATSLTTATSFLAGLMGLAIIIRLVWLRRHTQPLPAASHSPSAKFCPYCGTTLKENSKFCHACGNGVTR